VSRPWPGAFIALEGIDGSGTTTQALRLIQRLRQEGHDAVSAREPTDGPVGTLLRGLLAQNPSVQDGSGQGLGWEAMALLFAADRADHVQRLLQPSLAEGRVVVTDRFDLSSRIYQSLTSPDPERALPWVCSLNHRFPRPDLTLVLDIDEEVAAERRDGVCIKGFLKPDVDLPKKPKPDPVTATDTAPTNTAPGDSPPADAPAGTAPAP